MMDRRFHFLPISAQAFSLSLLVLFLTFPFSQTAEAALDYSPSESWTRIQPEFFSDRGSRTLALGVMATMFSFSHDQNAREYFAGSDRLGGREWVGNDVLGTGIPGVLLGASFWIYGDLKSESSVSHSGQAQLEAILLTSLANSLVKGLGNRQRPDGSDYLSFPSGHTSTIFATATVLNEFYGWKIGVPAYLLAAFTGASRISSDRHWLSDTVGGAALGIWVAQSVAQAHLRKEKLDVQERAKASTEKSSSLDMAPLFAPDRMQLLFRFSF